ncbi:hypothetical protein PoB_001713700 [Plakobranchus ocellatus]|uniref:Uncharacterized protein n=1 Tax=Plakobranchus ocellatus TaxID=259542 RepID=A0AAV3Z5U2_9GAST|nr:hypothetical protein PoB_001713700 [Plakobranchus ocellatus]
MSNHSSKTSKRWIKSNVANSEGLRWPCVSNENDEECDEDNGSDDIYEEDEDNDGDADALHDMGVIEMKIVIRVIMTKVNVDDLDNQRQMLFYYSLLDLLVTKTRQQL